MIRDIVERSALIIALYKSFPDGLEISTVKSALPAYRDHIVFLKNMGLSIKVNEEKVVLKTPIQYDLYQSIPPEIRQDVENILWKLISKEPLVEYNTVKEWIYQPIESVIDALVSRQPPSLEELDHNDIKWISRGEKKFPLACIQCAEPKCSTYGITAFGTTDRFATRVCPSNALAKKPDGTITINKRNCGGCMLCVLRCPLNALFFRDGVAVKRDYSNLPTYNVYLKKALVQLERKRQITNLALEEMKNINTPFRLGASIKTILDNFSDKMLEYKLNWDQDPYYVWVRNCFRELGLKATYTGAPGALKRADVTLRSPFYAGLEVKSPAEGRIPVGAIRKAADAASEVSDTYQIDTKYCAVIGKEIGRGCHKKSVSFYESYGVKIPLIRDQYLLYILLKHKTGLLQDPEKDIKRLFTDFYGWFGRDELIEYFRKYFELRKNELSKENISLIMPREVTGALKSDDRDKALKILEQLGTQTYAEIKRCFPRPERKARGAYAIR